jgi:hypothetical protein
MPKQSATEEFLQITRQLYAVISASPDDRDWNSVRDLYHPRATLVRTGMNEDGTPFVTVMNFDEYIDNVSDHLTRVSFSEKELSQDVTVFGNVARLVSVYEFRFIDGGQTTTGRGVNFFNLVNDGRGWKIINIVWDNERDGVALNYQGIPQIQT